MFKLKKNQHISTQSKKEKKQASRHLHFFFFHFVQSNDFAFCGCGDKFSNPGGETNGGCFQIPRALTLHQP